MIVPDKYSYYIFFSIKEDNKPEFMLDAQTPSCFSPNSRQAHLAVSCSGRGIWKNAIDGNLCLLRTVN